MSPRSTVLWAAYFFFSLHFPCILCKETFSQLPALPPPPHFLVPFFFFFFLPLFFLPCSFLPLLFHHSTSPADVDFFLLLLSSLCTPLVERISSLSSKLHSGKLRTRDRPWLFLSRVVLLWLFPSQVFGSFPPLCFPSEVFGSFPWLFLSLFVLEAAAV